MTLNLTWGNHLILPNGARLHPRHLWNEPEHGGAAIAVTGVLSVNGTLPSMQNTSNILGHSISQKHFWETTLTANKCMYWTISK